MGLIICWSGSIYPYSLARAFNGDLIDRLFSPEKISVGGVFLLVHCSAFRRIESFSV